MDSQLSYIVIQRIAAAADKIIYLLTRVKAELAFHEKLNKPAKTFKELRQENN